MSPKDLFNKIIRMPSGNGHDHFRVIGYNELRQEFLLYKLAVQMSKDGVLQLAQKAFATTPVREPLERIKALPSELTTPVDLEMPPATEMLRTSLNKEQDARYQRDVTRYLDVFDHEKLLYDLTYRTYRTYLNDLDGDRMTLTRALGRYFQFGMDAHKAAMAGIFRDRRLVKARSVTKKLGRTPKLVKSGHAPHLTGINTEDCHRFDIEVFLRQTPNRHSRGPTELYKEFKSRFIDRMVGSLSDGTPIMDVDPTKAITLSQFVYALKKLESARQQAIVKVSRSKWSKDREVLIGTARDGIRYPGQVYVIDSTIADVYLVCAMDGKILVGRPVIYAVIDAFSSVILSIHVTVDTSNVDQAKVALYRAVTPKDAWLKSLGAPHEFGAALPAGCKPTALFCDRGEILSKAGLEMAKTMKFALRLAAPYRADWKSLVERLFGIINDRVLHWAPGGVRDRAKERGERDVRYDGVLSINGLQRLMLSLAAEWNQTHNMSKHVSAAMLRHEITATPLEFWNYGLKYLHPAAEWFTRDDAARQLLPTIESILSRRGAELLEDLRFTADWMKADDRYYEQRESARGKVLLDPDDPLGAYLVDDQSGDLRHMRMVDTRNYQDHDVALEDVRVVEEYTRLCGLEEKHNNSGIAATHEAYRRAEIRTAEKKAKLDKSGDTRSLADQVGNIHEVKAAILIGAAGNLKDGSGKGHKRTDELVTRSDSTYNEFDDWDVSFIDSLTGDQP
ncbi:hypothetical protein [Roseateles sp.]|uniref:hypothetical protein n=1 Tax=Roseateles sp. TaxID=1971397 RepID=UPI003D0D17FB